MAAEILKGEAKAGDMPFKTIDESFLYVNSQAAEQLGITLNDAVIERARENFTTITRD